MSEFTTQWSQLTKSERRQVRKDMEAQAMKQATHKMGLFATGSQLKAAARKMVDIAIARAK